jgi:hypothetical protein
MNNEQTVTISLTPRQAQYLLNAIIGMSKKTASKVYINPTESIAIYDQLRQAANKVQS